MWAVEMDLTLTVDDLEQAERDLGILLDTLDEVDGLVDPDISGSITRGEIKIFAMVPDALDPADAITKAVDRFKAAIIAAGHNLGPGWQYDRYSHRAVRSELVTV